MIGSKTAAAIVATPIVGGLAASLVHKVVTRRALSFLAARGLGAAGGVPGLLVSFAVAYGIQKYTKRTIRPRVRQ